MPISLTSHKYFGSNTSETKLVELTQLTVTSFWSVCTKDFEYNAQLLTFKSCTPHGFVPDGKLCTVTIENKVLVGCFALYIQNFLLAHCSFKSRVTLWEQSNCNFAFKLAEYIAQRLILKKTREDFIELKLHSWRQLIQNTTAIWSTVVSRQGCKVVVSLDMHELNCGNYHSESSQKLLASLTTHF